MYVTHAQLFYKIEFLGQDLAITRRNGKDTIKL